MNHAMSLRKTIAVAAMGLASLAAQAEGAGRHWSYHGHGGPERWAELDPAFEACASGMRQSPINIHKTEKADLPPLGFAYGSVSPTFWNNGHTVQVNLPAGNSLKVADQSYELLQFHFHTPSEEAVGGKRAAMVAHFVHKNAEGRLGVVGVLMQPGKRNAGFDAVFAHLPRAGERITVDDLKLDLAGLLPTDHGYYSFEGSLTTPPCSEGVSWMVLKSPITVSPGQIRAFRKLVHDNARPLQPLHARVIRESL